MGRRKQNTGTKPSSVKQKTGVHKRDASTTSGKSKKRKGEDDRKHKKSKKREKSPEIAVVEHTPGSFVEELDCTEEGCDMTYTSHLEFYRHVNEHPRTKLTCPRCRRKFQTQSTWEDHLREEYLYERCIYGSSKTNYPVEAITWELKFPATGRTIYRTKFKGFHAVMNQWSEREDVQDLDAFHIFMEKKEESAHMKNKVDVILTLPETNETHS